MGKGQIWALLDRVGRRSHRNERNIIFDLKQDLSQHLRSLQLGGLIIFSAYCPQCFYCHID